MLALIRIAILISVLATTSVAFGQFTKIDTIPTTTIDHHGLAFDGTNWHVARIFGTPSYSTYSETFSFLGDVTVPGTGEVRGLTYDENSGNLFIGAFRNSTIHEVTTAGAEIQHFSVGSDGMNALAYDPISDTIWLARFNGQLERWGRTGGMIESFTTPGLLWTGLALDTCNGNLLLLHTDDTLYEYTPTGILVGQLIDTDQIDGNGQGLSYDASTGTLYASSQASSVEVFQDTSRIDCVVYQPTPVPSIGLPARLILTLLLGVLGIAYVVRMRVSA